MTVAMFAAAVIAGTVAMGFGFWLTSADGLHLPDSATQYRLDVRTSALRACFNLIGVLLTCAPLWLMGSAKADYVFVALMAGSAFLAFAVNSAAGGLLLTSIHLRFGLRAGFRTMEFWEVAHAFGILRRRGVGYQFRHRLVQESIATTMLGHPTGRASSLVKLSLVLHLSADQFRADGKKFEGSIAYVFERKINQITRYNLAFNLAEAGLFDAALKQVVRAIEIRPYWRDLYFVRYSRLHVALLIALNDLESAVAIQERYVDRVSKGWYISERRQAAISKRDLVILKEMLAEKRIGGSRPVNRTSMVGLQDVLPR
jgi:hypothetical protein